MDLINQYMDVIIAALVVLAALVVAMTVWRAFSLRVRGRRGQRLGISEYQEIDKTRRLVLIRRDNVEHLVMIGGPQDVVVETGIGVAAPTAFGTAADAGAGEDAARPIPMRAAPRPPVFGDRRAPPLRSVERNDPPLAGSRGRDPDQA